MSVLGRIESQRRPYGRHALEWTDERLARLLSTERTERLGIDPWRRLRLGAPITSTQLALLADALSVSPDWLLTGEPAAVEALVSEPDRYLPTPEREDPS